MNRVIIPDEKVITSTSESHLLIKFFRILVVIRSETVRMITDIEIGFTFELIIAQIRKMDEVMSCLYF